MTLTVIIFFVLFLVIVLLLLNIILAPSSLYPEKISVYECGFNNVDSPRNTFSIAFYIVAILFLIFDLEIALFYPVAVCLNIVSVYGLIVGLIFIIILTIGFVYEYCSKAIDISKPGSTHV